MSRTFDIPGGTATYRDVTQITGNGRKWVRSAMIAADSALQKFPPEAFTVPPDDETAEQAAERAARMAGAMSKVRFTREESDRLQEMYEASAVALLESWTLPDPLPTLDTIGDLPGDLYDKLIDEARGIPASDVGASTDFAPSTDDNSPTSDSESSSGPSKVDPGSPQTQTPSPDGTPSAGVPPSPVQ